MMMESNKIFEKFQKNVDWIKDRTVFLVRHGSHAYGTNIATSDEDFKGIAIPPKPYYLGSQFKFEQAELKDPDTVIYEIRKFFNLASSCNPNIIEVLFTDPSDHVIVDPIGQIILDNKEKFLSKRIKHTFSGYAFSQLKRIKTHRRWIMNPPAAPPTRESLGLPNETLIPKNQLEAATAEIQKELDRFQFDFMEELPEPMKISIRNTMSEMLGELKITSDMHWMAAARKIGLSDNFIELMKQERSYNTLKDEWDHYQIWKKTRNVARYDLEEKYGYDTKHAYHLVRLIRMCRETLTTGKVFVKRDDREELLHIRNGGWKYDDLIEFAESEEKSLKELYEVSNILPNKPDHHYIDNLCIELVEKSLSRFSWYNIRKSIVKSLQNANLHEMCRK